jgi:hypothetical protein
MSFSSHIFNKNKKIEMIVNIYMQNYSNAVGGGIGDFIRGSLFLLQFCMVNNIRFDIDYQNHPVAKYLYKKYNKIEEPINYKDIEYYFPDNITVSEIFYKNFINHLESIQDKRICLFSNNNPMYKISNFEKQFIKDKFLPTEELIQIVNNKMIQLGLTEKKFTTIHIRINDSVFNNDVIDNDTLLKLKEFIKNVNVQCLSKKKLLLTNSNKVKKVLKNIFNDLIIDINNVTHLALSNNDLSIRDTLCDMFMISKSEQVFSVSSYAHGTGFSKYICLLYDIPYYPSFFI